MSNNFIGRYFDNIVKGIANISTLTYIAFSRCKIPCSCVSDLFKFYLQNEKVFIFKAISLSLFRNLIVFTFLHIRVC